jgi:hypothetical protein
VLTKKMAVWVQLRDVCVLTGPFVARKTVRNSFIRDRVRGWVALCVSEE